MNTICKDVKGFEGTHTISHLGVITVKPCEVSRARIYSGRVITHTYTRSEKVLTPTYSKDGYLQISFGKTTHKVHRWVANTFIPNPENKPQVNHKDGDKSNNSVYNLEWCTAKENVIHSYQLGLACNKGERHPRSILKECHIPLIRNMGLEGKKCREIAPLFGVCISTVRKVLRRELWGHIE